MRDIVVIATASLLAAVFVLVGPERGWSDVEAFLGVFAIMLVVGGLGWHTRLFDRLGP